MPYSAIVVRALVAYLWLLLLTRLDGKRGIAEASAFDFVLALIIGDTVDNVLWGEVPPAVFLAATGTLVLTHFAVSLGACFSDRISWLTSGAPSGLVAGGAFVEAGMRAERMRREDVLGELRKHRVTDLRDVRSTDMETTGITSVLREEPARDADRRDLPRLPARPGRRRGGA
ncbi:MAG: DUF421 domain-containing protein [Candidatus Rokuibacteriota bacterium]